MRLTLDARFRISRRAALLASLGVGALSSARAHADGYPTRPIRFIAAFPAGGGVDALARVVGEVLSRRLGQPVVVENRAGAAGVVGSAAAAAAEADGYTILVTSNPSITIAAAGPRRGYDPLRDLAPLVKAATAPSILVTNRRQPFATAAEMIAVAKARPGTLSYATAGTGSTQHVEMEALKAQLGLDMVHVPYRGTALLLPDVLSGQMPIGVPAVPASSSLVASGELVGLAVLGPERSPALPAVPTFREATGMDVPAIPSWFGFLVPSALPPVIRERLEAEILSILAIPDVKAKLLTLGMTVTPRGSSEFRTENEAEAALIQSVFNRQGIRLGE